MSTPVVIRIPRVMSPSEREYLQKQLATLDGTFVLIPDDTEEYLQEIVNCLRGIYRELRDTAGKEP